MGFVVDDRNLNPGMFCKRKEGISANCICNLSRKRTLDPCDNKRIFKFRIWPFYIYFDNEINNMMAML